MILAPPFGFCSTIAPTFSVLQEPSALAFGGPEDMSGSLCMWHIDRSHLTQWYSGERFEQESLG